MDSRHSFLPPLKEHELAAQLLSDAVDAVIERRVDDARKLIKAADFDVLRDFAQKVAGKYDPDIHRFREIPGAPPPSTSRTKRRMPSTSISRSIFKRDGWRCRFCEVKVISVVAIKILDGMFPEEIRNRPPMREIHGGIRALAASLDHILPHSRGGDNSPENLVCACGPCQFGRNQWTLEEVGFSDPRERPAIVDEWDGLTRLLKSDL